jgi:hypothetical protein
LAIFEEEHTDATLLLHIRILHLQHVVKVERLVGAMMWFLAAFSGMSKRLMLLAA